ncbi:MAG: 4Fe-4S binding protein [Muribaculaceae bacterium]|nr:4Fe-4S binding protein [Muribaculaceae bacterium]
MLRIIRITFAILSLLAVTALFVDVTGFARAHWSWMAGIQLVPAILSLNMLVVAALVAVTLIFGRVYCSVVCPLGIYQDVVNRLSIMFLSKKKRKIGKFRYVCARSLLRWGVLAVFVLLLVAGTIMAVCTWTASFVEPYSAYGRMATWLLRPLGVEVNNTLAEVSAENGSYIFAHVVPMAVSVPLLSVAVVTFIVITIYAWNSGRDYCNEICPVGTVLGYISRNSWFKPNISLDKCTSCGACARHCKASCIDPKKHSIDYSRCLSCMDCISHCSTRAITYSHPTPGKDESKPAKEPDMSRRIMLAGGAIVAGSAMASAIGKDGDGGFAPLKDKRPPERRTPIVPPGAKGGRWLASHCTACQLCISGCPNEVLSPSTNLSTFMQPVMDFSKGYCRPECTACSDVCPAGAILPIDVETKSSTKIGTAEVDYRICISAYGQKCGRCATGCPTGAIEMISMADGNLRPVVNEAVCIGCGACEYHCPVGTVASNRADRAAIHVEGVESHHII